MISPRTRLLSSSFSRSWPRSREIVSLCEIRVRLEIYAALHSFSARIVLMQCDASVYALFIQRGFNGRRALSGDEGIVVLFRSGGEIASIVEISGKMVKKVGV